MVGEKVGDGVGRGVGDSEGASDGLTLGTMDGDSEGDWDGLAEGDSVVDPSKTTATFSKILVGSPILSTNDCSESGGLTMPTTNEIN
jgi:hypothetical protein